MKINSSQTMMIVWKWKELTHVNEKNWEDPAFIEQDYIAHIKKGNGLFYEQYPVEWSEQCPNAQLIAASVYQIPEKNQHSGKNKALLDAIIDRYLPPLNKKNKKQEEEQTTIEDHQFMLFLHRGNEYTQKDIDRLFKKYGQRINKIFLFSNKRDFIYYAVQRKGLIDDIGYFFKGEDNITGEYINVCGVDKSGKTYIKQPYFDRCWLHYKIEFETKVFNLKEDLFESWFAFLWPNASNAIKKQALLDALLGTKNALLYYRLKSFLGFYAPKEIKSKNFDERDQLENEIDTLKDYETTDKKSYLFDDCLINLDYQKKQKNTFISNEYDDIRANMIALFFKDDKTDVTKNELRQLMDKLNYLVKIIPGLMDMNVAP